GGGFRSATTLRASSDSSPTCWDRARRRPSKYLSAVSAGRFRWNRRYNPNVSISQAPTFQAAASSAATRYRRVILALLFFATTINYLDRIVLGFMLPLIRAEMHLTDQDYEHIQGAFQIAYMAEFRVACMFLVRIGYT